MGFVGREVPMFSSCPVCNLSFPLQEIEWHVNKHLVDEEFERDMELAHQIALAPESPPRSLHTGSNSASPNGICASGYEGHTQEKIDCLIRLQIRSTFYRVEEGLMSLLRNCLELERENTCSIISGHVDHFQSIYLEDSGWGCGWRNIQMLCSHLLVQRHDAAKVLCGGSGFVPDIPSLQRWVEIAWERGFDMFGPESFKRKLYGSTRWIGTTECATLLRSFGLRARIVDFGKKTGEQAITKNGQKGKNMQQNCGPMDRYLHERHSDARQVGPSKCEESRFYGMHGENEFAPCTHRNNFALADHGRSNKCKVEKIDCHRILVDWVWNYFSGKGSVSLGNLQRVLVSEKTPLYFQHDGHSRTIVGVQIQKGSHAMPERCTLLVLDPSQRTATLAKSLRENVGWQRLVKRGIHTLKKPQYQLCYVDPGIAQGKEMEELKILDSVFFEC